MLQRTVFPWATHVSQYYPRNECSLEELMSLGTTGRRGNQGENNCRFPPPALFRRVSHLRVRTPAKNKRHDVACLRNSQSGMLSFYETASCSREVSPSSCIRARSRNVLIISLTRFCISALIGPHQPKSPDGANLWHGVAASQRLGDANQDLVSALIESCRITQVVLHFASGRRPFQSLGPILGFSQPESWPGRANNRRPQRAPSSA